MADINQAYGTIFENDTYIRKISHFFTQRKITESQDTINIDTLKRTKKDVNFSQNYLALVLPKDESSSKLIMEIYGNKGYCFQGELLSFTQNSPHLLIPLNDDKEIFVMIYDYAKQDPDKIKEDTLINKEILNKKKIIKYLSFIHVPKRYQNIDDEEDENENDSSKICDLKQKNHSKISDLKNKDIQTQHLRVNL